MRERATQLVSLLKDEERLRNERDKSLKNKERFSKQTTAMGSHTGQVTGMPTSGSAGGSGYRPGNTGEEELQLQLALAMSKEEAENKVIVVFALITGIGNLSTKNRLRNGFSSKLRQVTGQGFSRPNFRQENQNRV